MTEAETRNRGLGGWARVGATAALAATAWLGCARPHLRATPRLDPRAAAMQLAPAQVPVHDASGALPYFLRPIPRAVHQIWFGDTGAWRRRSSRHERAHTEAWAAYAGRFGYSYRMWTDADLPALVASMPEDYAATFVHAHRTRQWRLASDLARLAIGRALGGVYVDCDMAPPRDADGEVALHALLPEQGLVLMTERNHRDIGATGLFVANGFFMTAPHHPVFEHLVAHVGENVRSLTQHGASLRDPIFAAGCMALNRALAGVFYVVPLDDLVGLGVVQEVASNWRRDARVWSAIADSRRRATERTEDPRSTEAVAEGAGEQLQASGPSPAQPSSATGS